jgi:hypothetical protein
MAKLSVAEEFDIAVKSAAREADPKTTSRQAAEEFYRVQPELVEPFREAWIVERLAGLIGKHRARIKRESNEQLVFEGLLGFGHLPKKLELRSGEALLRGEATMGAFRQHRALLWKRGHPGIAEMDKAITLMEKYAKIETDITWAEVVKREAEKVGRSARACGPIQT